MTKQEQALKLLCIEVAQGDIQTDRFTQLWMESGISLSDKEFEILQKIIDRYHEDTDTTVICRTKVIH